MPAVAAAGAGFGCGPAVAVAVVLAGVREEGGRRQSAGEAYFDRCLGGSRAEGQKLHKREIFSQDAALSENFAAVPGLISLPIGDSFFAR